MSNDNASVVDAARADVTKNEICGLVSAAVADRKQEIGIRMALGARCVPGTSLVVREALGPAIVGLAIGLLAGAGVSVLLRGFLYGLSPHDPVTIMVASAILLGTVALVAWLPARIFHLARRLGATASTVAAPRRPFAGRRSQPRTATRVSGPNPQ